LSQLGFRAGVAVAGALPVELSSEGERVN